MKFILKNKKNEINSYWMPTIILKKSLKITRKKIFEKFEYLYINKKYYEKSYKINRIRFT